MSKMGHTPRSLALHVDSHSAVPMTADDCYRRRMEGMRMHYGPAIPYTDDGYAMIAQVLQQTLADVMGLPLRWIQGATGIIQHPDESDADFIQRRVEDDLAHAFFHGRFEDITQPVETDASLRERMLFEATCGARPAGADTLDVEVATGRGLDALASLYNLRRF